MCNNQSLSDLEKGIEQLLLKRRCLFSEEEVLLLNECSEILKEIQSRPPSNTVETQLRIWDVVKILAEVFEVYHLVKDIL